MGLQQDVQEVLHLAGQFRANYERFMRIKALTDVTVKKPIIGTPVTLTITNAEKNIIKQEAVDKFNELKTKINSIVIP